MVNLTKYNFGDGDEEKDSKAAPTPTIEGEVPCVSPPIDEEDNNDEEDNDDNDEDEEDDDDNEDKKDDCNFDLNNVKGMSEYTQEQRETCKPQSARGHDVSRLPLLRPHQ